jgi:hypothetical protein
MDRQEAIAMIKESRKQFELELKKEMRRLQDGG